MHVVVFNMGNTTYYPGQHSLWSGTRTLEQSESQLLIPVKASGGSIMLWNLYSYSSSSASSGTGLRGQQTQ
ncbi:hypothetical protein ILYODFUR_029906 [Ilyodon furcidens]|uniref:Uncharacterized protein n=1 Tax=Ilyodon furcidens TaxID=33524 RepID=A0ABV0TC88_9TELE